VEYWRRYIADEGGDWPDEFKRRLDPDAPIDDPLLVRCLERIPHPRVSVIDVGAGPLTLVGRRFPGKEVELVPVDPLAVDYARLLDEAGIEPHTPTIGCSGEELLDRFGEASFDIAFARNSLDHAADPAGAVLNLLSVVRPGRFVVLKHFENEAKEGGSHGLHQWNFEVRDGRLHLWREGAEDHDLAELVAGRATVEAGQTGAWVWGVLTRAG
jgi:SAM-dependent methyltransferase